MTITTLNFDMLAGGQRACPICSGPLTQVAGSHAYRSAPGVTLLNVPQLVCGTHGVMETCIRAPDQLEGVRALFPRAKAFRWDGRWLPDCPLSERLAVIGAFLDSQGYTAFAVDLANAAKLAKLAETASPVATDIGDVAGMLRERFGLTLPAGKLDVLSVRAAVLAGERAEAREDSARWRNAVNPVQGELDEAREALAGLVDAALGNELPLGPESAAIVAAMAVLDSAHLGSARAETVSGVVRG